MNRGAFAVQTGKAGISVIIPVLHEAERINDLIEHVRALPSPVPVELLVVDGSPAGDTLHAIRGSNVGKVKSSPGRAHQMNAGAGRASGDILLFLHADTLLPRDAMALVCSSMADGRFAAGAFSLGIKTDRRIFRITEAYVALRTRLTRIPFGDQAIFIRKDYFDELGGYREIPIMEDVELMGRIKGRGDRICIIPKQVLTSPRRWEKDGIVCGTLRNWALQILYVLGVPPERLAKFYH